MKKGAVGIVFFLSIVLIVALIAVPAWRNHTARIHVSEAINAADGAKLVVMEAATTHGGLDRVSVSDLAYDSSSAASPYVAHIAIGADGRITIATRGTGASPDPVLLLVPSEAATAAVPLRWDCVVTRGKADLAPGACHAAEEAPAAAGSAPAPGGSAGG